MPSLDAHTLLASAPVDQKTSWSCSSLNLSEAEFDSLVDQLFDLELRGLVEIVGTRKESYTGKRYHTAVMLIRRE